MTWSCPIFSFSLLSERSFCRRAIASGDWYSSYLPTTVHSKVPTRYRNIYKNVCHGWTFVQNIILFIFKWANPGLFCLFSSSSSHYNFNNTNWKKHRWCAGDLNPCSHDGRRWQYHGAMSAAQVLLLPSTYSTVGIFRNEEKNTKLSLHMHWLIELRTWYPLIPAMGPSIPNHFEIFLFETHTQKKQ